MGLIGFFRVEHWLNIKRTSEKGWFFYFPNNTQEGV